MTIIVGASVVKGFETLYATSTDLKGCRNRLADNAVASGECLVIGKGATF